MSMKPTALRTAMWVSPIAFSLLTAGSAATFTQAEIDQAAIAARDVGIIAVIADDLYQGRNNDTAGSAAIQAVLIAELALLGDGLDTSEMGHDAYRQPFDTPLTGTNLLAVIPGTDLASEYVLVGGHYDHLGTNGVDIFNGATDNAAGAAAVLAVGKAIRALPTAPRRSIILALWDAEEDGLVGSKFFADNPLIPLSSIVGYVNFDIQGANLLPSLRDFSFAVGAESGGAVLQGIVDAAVANQDLGTRKLSRLFGQERSDHANFIDDIPTVFFTDATGPCYHTPGDDITVVDIGKLREESQIAFRVTLELAEATSPPPLVPTPLLAGVYEDAVVVSDIVNATIAGDLDRFSASTQTTLLSVQNTLNTIVVAGPGSFTQDHLLASALVAEATLAELATLPCDGFVPEPGPGLLGMTAVLGLAAIRRRRAS